MAESSVVVMIRRGANTAGSQGRALVSMWTREARHRKMAGVSPRGVHPALEQEALKMVQRSGAVSRKMQIRRM